jgi:hypothetical protein
MILKWIREIGWDSTVCIHLAQDKDQWRALANTAMNFEFDKTLGSALVAERLLASQEEIGSRSSEYVVFSDRPISEVERM